MSNRAVQTLKAMQRELALDNIGLANLLRVPLPTLSGWIHHGKIPRRSTVAELDRRGLCSSAYWYLPPAQDEQSDTVEAAE